MGEETIKMDENNCHQKSSRKSSQSSSQSVNPVPFMILIILITIKLVSSSGHTIIIDNERINTDEVSNANNDNKAQKRQDLSSLMVNGPDAADILQAAFAQAGVDLGGNIEPADASSFLSKRPSIASRLRNIKLPSLPSSITSAFNRRKVTSNGGSSLHPMGSMLMPVMTQPPSSLLFGGQHGHRSMKPVKLFGLKNIFSKNKEQQMSPHHPFVVAAPSGAIPSFVLHPNNYHNPINDQYIVNGGSDNGLSLKSQGIQYSSPNNYNQQQQQPAYVSYESPSSSSSSQQLNSNDGQGNGHQPQHQQYHVSTSLTSDQIGNNNYNNNNNNGIQKQVTSNLISLTNNGHASSSSLSPSSSSFTPLSSSSLSPSASSSSSSGHKSSSSSFMVNLNHGGDNWTPTSALSSGGFKPIHDYPSSISSSSSSGNHNYNNNNQQQSPPTFSSLISNNNQNNNNNNNNSYSSLINTETKRASHSLYESFAKLNTDANSNHKPNLLSSTSSFVSSSPTSSVIYTPPPASPAPVYPAPSFAPTSSALTQQQQNSFGQQTSKTYDPWKYQHNDSVPEESSNDILKYLAFPSYTSPLTAPQNGLTRSKVAKDVPMSSSLTSSAEDDHQHHHSTESILSGLHKIFPINPSALLEQINKNEHLIKSKSSIDCQNKHLGWCDFTDNYPTPFVVAVIKECRDVIERMYVEVPANLADFDDYVPFSPIFSSSSSNGGQSINKTTSDSIDTSSKVSSNKPINNKSRQIKSFSSNSLSSKLSEWPSIASYRSSRSINDDLTSSSETTSSSRSLCDSDKKFVRPSVAQDITGRWFVIVQSSLYHQQVPVEICRNPGSGCNNISECGSGARCVQKFNTQLLISIDLDKENDCPSMRLYRFPSGCVCDRPHYY